MNTNKLKELRKQKNLLQKDMAAMLNVAKSTYCYWEQGKIEIDFANLKLLANFFNVSIDYLIGGETTMDKEKAPTDTASAEAHEIMIQLKRAGLTEKLNKLNDKQMKALLAVLDSYTDNGNEKP